MPIENIEVKTVGVSSEFELLFDLYERDVNH